MKDNKKVVVLGGGSGTSVVVKGLKYFPIDLTCVITVSDNGSSTGRLRREFRTPAVGDIRQVLSNLSTLPDEIRDVMEYRLETYSDLNGHAIGNLLLTSLIRKTGSFKTSIEYLSRLLDVKQKVLPLSEDLLTLMAETKEGEVIEGEAEITEANKRFERLYYKEIPTVLPDVIDAINEADLIILSTGSLYTSLLPHLICEDVCNAIRGSKAKVMYICNAMTQPGETEDFTVTDHVDEIEKYLGKDEIDVVVGSNSKISNTMLKKYANKERKAKVEIDHDEIAKRKFEFIEKDLITIADGTIKHDSLKVSSVIFEYLLR